MKLKSLLVATVAVAGLASCSSDKIGQDGGVSGLNDIKVSVTVPNAFTRGAIEGGITDGTPILNNLSAYLLRGTSQVAKVGLTGSEGKYSAFFSDLSLNGTERVVITANNANDVIDPQGYKIMDIQSNGTDNVAAIYYFDTANLSSVVPKTENNKKIYTLDKMVLKPEASRVEVSGEIAFDDVLVKSVDVTEMTPNNYSETHGATTKFLAKSTGNKANVTDAEAKATLGKLANGEFYDQITNSDKVVANHLFNKDEKRISFRMNAIVYDVLKNAKGERLKPVNSANVQLNSYVYQATAGAEGSEVTKLFIREDKKYFELLANDKGQIQVAGKKYDKSTTEKANDVELDTYSTITDKNAGYFNMVKFAALKGDVMESDPSRYYEQGKIYKVLYNKIDWNNDGKVDDSDKYNPDDNGDGSETPSNFEGDITVGATVMKWDLVNSGVSIE